MLNIEHFRQTYSCLLIRRGHRWDNTEYFRLLRAWEQADRPTDIEGFIVNALRTPQKPVPETVVH